MPRYPKEVTAALKNGLRARGDNDYHFTEDDIAELAEKTKKTREEIVQWAIDKRSYYSTEQLVKFLESDGTVSEINYGFRLV
jgi:hypothetical protein